MLGKSLQKEVKKYSNVVKTVKDRSINNETKKQTSQEDIKEPKLTEEEVINIFNSFGFEPNSENNDVIYWTSRSESERDKLIEELYNKRREINTQNSQEQENKKTAPRLSDEEILSLYDEYGLPTPDPEWARNHMPNDITKLRSILETQSKITNDSIKQKAKEESQVNSMTNKFMGGSSAPSGMGGPIQLPNTDGQQEIGIGAKPFFIGDHSLIRMTNPSNPNASTIWLVDAQKKVLRPFLNKKAFENAFENPEEANEAIVTVSSTALGPGGVLEGFTPLKGQKGVKEDGSMDKIDFSPAQIKNNFGKPIDPQQDQKGLAILDGLFGKIRQQKQQ